MKIKGYYKIIIAVAVLFSASCTDLSTELTDSIGVETSTGSFSGDPAALLATSYNRLGDIVGSSYGGCFTLNETPSDELIIPTRSTDWGNNGVFRVLHTHTWDARHSDLLSVWDRMNRVVYSSNQVLVSNPTALQAAEAKALRAYFMFYAMDFFGQVPFREVDEGVDVDPRVMSRSEAFDFIIADLEAALPVVPEWDGGANKTQVNKAFIHTLMARMYLNKAVYTSANPAGPYTFAAEDMNQVISHCDQAASAGFEYETDYFQNFTEGSGKEHIFAATNYTSGMHVWPQLHNAQGGWNGPTTLPSFYNKFEAQDTRIGYVPASGLGRGFLVGQQYGADGQPLLNRSGNPLVLTPEVSLIGNPDYTGIRVVKYLVNGSGPYALMRYPDIRLMKAEAILRGGTPTQNETAQGIVDELRAARGASNMAVSLEMLLDERGREFYWEGYRRMDQIRFGTYITGTWEYKTVQEPHLVLYPIPQVALDSNPNLVQNPGY
jgi:hypothetical protein